MVQLAAATSMSGHTHTHTHNTHTHTHAHTSRCSSSWRQRRLYEGASCTGTHTHLRSNAGRLLPPTSGYREYSRNKSCARTLPPPWCFSLPTALPPTSQPIALSLALAVPLAFALFLAFALALALALSLALNRRPASHPLLAHSL